MGFFENIGGFFTDTLPGVFTGAFDAGKEVVNTVWYGAKDGVSDIYSGAKSGINRVADVAENAANKGLDAFSGLSNILSNPILVGGGIILALVIFSKI
jgi:hypothetical protein